MKKLFALLMAVTLTFQLVTPVFAEDPEQANADTLPQETEVLVDETKGPDETEEPAETEGPGETEKPTEADAPTAATETDKTVAAETVPTEAEPSEESSALIRVTFIRTPADLTLTVYAADTDTEIDPQEDDTYLLAPGEYTYLAELDGYISEENTFTVSEVDEANREISVELQCADMEDDASFDSGDYSLQLSRIDDLYERIKKNGGFFTVNREPCVTGSGHRGCDNCKLKNVINSDWFTTEFGANVTCSKFAMNTTGSAYTCTAFASFAGWFVNRRDDNDSVSTASRESGDFSFEFFSSCARPGDSILMKVGEKTHNAIFISCNKQGVYVLDGNNTGRACEVTKQTIPYSSKWSAVTISHLKSKQGGHTQQTAPAAPTNFKAVYVDNARAKLSWSASSGATSYEVQYWSVGSNAWKTDTSYSSGTSYTSTGLKNYSSWTFRVRAVNSAGKSDWVSCNYEKTHTHSYKQEFEAAHPHKVYMKCTSCGDWYYTGATTTVDSCTQCHPPVQQVYLDLNGCLNGRNFGSLENFGTCDVYIDEVKVADDCTDFYQSYPVGTKYSIEDIRATDGYTYLGEKGTSDASDGSVTMPFSALGGTLVKNTEVILEFKTADSGTCGDNLTWGLSEDGTLVIYGKGEMKDYVAVYDSTAEKWVSSAPWAGCSPKKIEIRNGITRIGNCAFYGCSDLTGTLSLPDSLKAVGNSAFEGCTGLSGRLLLPDRVESVGESAFRRCTGFDGKLVLPGNLVEIGSGAFAYCSGLSGELDIPGKIKNIGSGAFILCEGFTGKLTLYEGVQKICFRAFYGCTGIESIMAPESLSAIEDSAFERCSSLKDVYYSGTQTQWNLISVGNANEPLVNAGIHCDPYAPVASGTCGENLTWSLDGYGTLIISGSGDMQDFGADDSNAAPWSGKNPTKLVLSDDIISVGDYAFYKCSSITGKLTLPSRLRKIGKWAFDGCSGFTGNLALPQTLTEIRAGAFDRCSGFTGDLILPEEMEEIRAFVFNECKGFNGSLRLPQNIKIIDANAFRGCDNLTGKLELPATLTEIGGAAFTGCNFTGGLRIPGSVSSIGACAFQYCRGFSGTLEFSEGNTTIVGYSFSGCDGFTDVILPVSITNIGIAAFRNMTGLQNVYYGGSAQQWNEIEIGDYNDDLTNATIHYASTHIHDMVKTEAVEPTYWSVGNNAYYTCSRCGKVFKDANGETETTVEDETLAILPSIAHGTCGNEGDNLIWVLTEDGTLTISGSGNMQSYDSSTRIPWDSNRTKILSAVMEPGVTSIGECALSNCSNLISVTIPEGVTSIGYAAFWGCSSLTSVAIPDGVTDIGSEAFAGCSKLGSVTIPEGVTSIGYRTFRECSSLTSMTIPEGVTSIGDQAFMGCSSLTSVVIPGSVTSIDHWAFYSCSNLTSVTIPEGVTSIGEYTFAYCRSLASVTIPGSVTDIGRDAFTGCSSLTSVTIPDGVTSIGGGAFSACRSLTSVAIPKGVTSIGSYAFYGCSSLTSATISGSETSIGDHAFYGCYKLASVEILDGVTSIGESAFRDCSSLTIVTILEGMASIGDYAFRGCNRLISVTIPESVTSIGWGTFDGCSSLTSVTIPESVTSIGWGTFHGCSSLTSVTIPEGITSIDAGTFFGCSNLTNVVIPESVTSIGNQAFRDCSSLTSVTIPKGVISIADAAFYGCSSLTSVTIPEGVISIDESTFAFCGNLTRVTIPESVTSIGEYAFNYCSSLTSVKIPESVTSIGPGAFQGCSSLTSVKIPESVTSIGGSAFRGCSSLTGMTIPDGVTSIGYGTFQDCSNLVSVKIPESLASIGHCAFQGCSSLTSVTIPESVTSIGDAAFEACSGLTSVTIPDGVTSIGEKDFSCCISLTSVAIPESVTSIGDSAFDNCSKLKHVYYGGPDLQWAKIEIGVNNDALVNAIIHYGSSHIHNTEHIHGKAASCTEAGNLEYWLCSICGEYFTDETFTKSTDEAGVTLPALGHALTLKKAVKPTHKTAGNIEYYVCSRCGKLFKDALGTEETTLEEVTLPVIPYVSKIVLTRDGEPVPETMEVDGRTGDTLTFAAVVQPEGAETKVKWSSGTPAVAQVDQDGVVTLLTSGTTVIKAAATDGSRVTAQVTLNVTARDYAPRLGASALTLNSVSFAGVSVDLVESYGNQILSVSVDDERFDAEYADNLLTLTSREAVARGTYRMTLEAVCDDGRTYSYPITVRVIQTLPRLTVRQSQRFNLFYRDSQATLTITGGEVESAELTGNSDFVLENENGQWVIRYADPENIPAKPSTKATLSVLFAGYNAPVTKSVTIATVNTSPKLKLSPASSVLNTVLTEALEVRAQLAGTDDNNLSVWTDTPGAEVYLDDGTLTIGLSAAKAVTVNVYVQSDSWAKPVKLTHKVSVTTKKPTLKAVNSTLKLNSYFPSETASSGLILSQGNLSLSTVELTPTAKAGAAATESEKLSISYDLDSEEIVAEILDSSIKNGTYSFTCVGTLEDGTAISGGTIKVSVTNTLPKAKLSASTVKLNKRLTGEEATVKVTLTGGNGYTVTGFENLPDFMWYEDGILTVTLPEQSGTYPLYATVSRGGEEVVLPTAVKLTVQVYDKVPSFRLSAKGKLDVLNPDSEIIYTPKLTNALGTASDVELTGASADLFDAEVVNGTIHLTLAKSGDNYSTKATYKIVPLLTICDQQVKGPALSIKVTQSALKLASLPNRTVYTSQATPLLQTLHVTAPAAAEIGDVTLNAKTSAALRSALDTADGLQSRGATIAFPAKAFTGLKPGNYTVILDITPVNAASDSKPTQGKFTLTVKK